jgi:hypothetical protein
MNHDFFLEILSGGAVTPEIVVLFLLGIYLSKESRRRGLRALGWFHLPPSMNLILAVFIFDAGVCLRSETIWIWRFNGAGRFTTIEVMLLIAGGALIVFGGLCKVRALTHPDHGNRPWLISMLVTVASIAVLIMLR